MVPIVNARGVPGSIGALARGTDGTRYFISCNHVLYGGGATTGDTVWALDESGSRRSFIEIGRTVLGFLGQVTHDGRTSFIDCALGCLNDESRLPPPIRDAVRATTFIAGVACAVVNARVSKHGWITGCTRGFIVDVDYFDRPRFEERVQDTPGQILIRSDDEDQFFSDAGESGAAILDGDDRIIGFLWGCNTYGEGIAFPAAVALERFGIRLECAR